MPAKVISKKDKLNTPVEDLGSTVIDFEEDSIEEIESEEIETVPKKKQYVLKSKTVDKYTTIRTRVPLTPSMCTRTHCSYDVAKVAGYNGWSDPDIDETERPRMLSALQKHMDVVHSRAEDAILNEDEIPTAWLGDKKSPKRIM